MRVNWKLLVATAYVVYPGIYWIFDSHLPTRGPAPLVIGLAIPIITGILIREQWAPRLALASAIWVFPDFIWHRAPELRHAPWFGFVLALLFVVAVQAIALAVGVRVGRRLARGRLLSRPA
jgi:hypothetical protein